MKKFILILTIFFIVSCGKNESNKQNRNPISYAKENKK